MRAKHKGETKPTTRLEDLPESAFDRIPRVQLTLTDESAYLTRFDEKGCPSVTYPVSIQDTARAFSVFGSSTGLLPPDTLFWMQSANKSRIGIWLPPQVRKIEFDLGKRKTTSLQIPMPGFVFVGEGIQYFIFASERPTDENARLYHAPLPNVNPNGLICAGTVKFPPCASTTVLAAAKLFFESGFNHDLSEDKVVPQEEPVRLGQKPVTLFQYLKDLQGAKKFPREHLIPNNMSLKQIMYGERI